MCSVYVCVCVCWGLTPVWSKRFLNELVPEGTCTASWGSLSETFDWLDIEVRRWDTKVVPRPAFLIQLGPDKIAAGKTTNQIRWQFSTVSNYCCSQRGPDKINQMLEWFSHFWFLPYPFFSLFFFLKTLSCECEYRENSQSPSPFSEQNVKADLWDGLLGNGNFWLFMMFCRKVQYPPVTAAGLHWGFYKRSERRGVMVSTGTPLTQQLIRHQHINHVTDIESNRARQQLLKTVS